MIRKLTIAVLAAGLCSCGLEIPTPGGGTGRGTLGYFKEAGPAEGGRLGLFIEQKPAAPAAPVLAEK